MADARQPKGTLHTKRFGKGALVEATAHSKKHGYLVLIGATVLDRESVLAFYGTLTTRSARI